MDQRIVLLSDTPLDLATLLRPPTCGECGGVASFVGCVRHEQRDGRILRALEYSGYRAMVERLFEELAAEAAARDGALVVRIAHRLGVVSIGEPSILVVVGTPHRAEAFEACRRIVERVKADAPLFKRELWEDGGSSWQHDVAEPKT